MTEEKKIVKPKGEFDLGSIVKDSPVHNIKKETDMFALMKRLSDIANCPLHVYDSNGEEIWVGADIHAINDKGETISISLVVITSIEIEAHLVETLIKEIRPHLADGVTDIVCLYLVLSDDGKNHNVGCYKNYLSIP